MAGDWIKIEHATPDKPEIYQLAEILGIDPDAIVGKLVRLWTWADQQSVSGDDISVSTHVIDRLTHQPGFSAALRKVDWLQARSGSLAIPRFDRHNGQSAKARSETNRRVAEHRKNKKPNKPPTPIPNVTEKPLPKPLPEKRREEKNEEREKTLALATASPVSEEKTRVIGFVNSVHSAWRLPALSRKENTALEENIEIISSLKQEEWELLASYYVTKNDPSPARYAPPSRERFLGDIGDVLGHALEWQERQPKPRQPKPKPAPSDQPELTPAEMLAILQEKS